MEFNEDAVYWARKDERVGHAPPDPDEQAWINEQLDEYWSGPDSVMDDLDPPDPDVYG